MQTVNDRFFIFEEIETDAILSLNEDAQLVSDEVSHMLYLPFFYLASSAKLPTGLYILFALICFVFSSSSLFIFFNDFSETNYLRIRWTDFRSLFTSWFGIFCRISLDVLDRFSQHFHYMKALYVPMMDLYLIFQFVKGHCHGNQIMLP